MNKGCVDEEGGDVNGSFEDGIGGICISLKNGFVVYLLEFSLRMFKYEPKNEVGSCWDVVWVLEVVLLLL